MSGRPPVDPGGQLDAVDLNLLADVADLYTAHDPVPDGLADRALFALQLEDLEMELARLESGVGELVGARTEEQARTVTFTSDNLTVMVTLSPGADGRFRLDGWAAPGRAVPVELRTGGSSLWTAADDDGRFDFPEVPAGRFQLVLHPSPADGESRRLPVVTPAVEL